MRDCGAETRHCNSHPLKFLDARVARPIIAFGLHWPIATRNKNKTLLQLIFATAKGVETFEIEIDECLSSFADSLGTEGRAS